MYPVDMKQRILECSGFTTPALNWMFAANAYALSVCDWTGFLLMPRQAEKMEMCEYKPTNIKVMHTLFYVSAIYIITGK